jgi:hypothetical protein
VCNATEVMLRSGRDRNASEDGSERPLTPATRCRPEMTELCGERVELGIRQVGLRLDTVMRALSPYRTMNEDLHQAYREVHDALGDLAATYTWVSLGSRQARPARPGLRRRPWGG